MNQEEELTRKAVDYIGFCRTLSCGHCVPCRLGLFSLFRILRQLIGNPQAEAEMERLEKLVHTLEVAALCPIGRTSILPIKDLLSFLKNKTSEGEKIANLMEIVKCTSCGRPFSFKALLGYFQSRVDQSLGVFLDRIDCPDCIRKTRAAELAGEIQGY